MNLTVRRSHSYFKLFTLLLVLLTNILVFPSLVQAHAFKLGTLNIRHPYSVATVSGQTVGGVFFKAIDNQGDDKDYLISVKVDSSIAKRSELHVMNTDNDIMRMRQVKNIELPAKTVTPMTRGLKNLGYHIMLIDLKKPLLNGEKFNLTLTFKRAGTVKVVVNVEELTPNNKSIDSTNSSMTKPTHQDSVDAAHSQH
jgi:copper(I)-binding protein